MKRIGQRGKSNARKIDGLLFFIMDNCWPAPSRENVTHALNWNQTGRANNTCFLMVLKLFSFHEHHNFYHSIKFHYGCVKDFRQTIKICKISSKITSSPTTTSECPVCNVISVRFSHHALTLLEECFSCSRSPSDTRDISKESCIKFWPTWKGICGRPA